MKNFARNTYETPSFYCSSILNKRGLLATSSKRTQYSCQKAAVLRINLEISWLYKISRSFINFMLFASNTYEKWLGRKTLSRIIFCFHSAHTFCRGFPIAHFHNTFRCIVHLPQCFTHQLFCLPFINMFNTKKR